MGKLKQFYTKLADELGLEGNITHPDVKKAADQIIQKSIPSTVPQGIGLVECDHCGLSFDLADVKDKLKIFAQPYCLDCRELDTYKDIEAQFLAAYEPPEQS